MDVPYASLPFTVRVLDDAAAAAPESPRDLTDLMPATTRTRHDQITVPGPSDTDFLERELLVHRLNDVQDLLWICGRPMPPRPLHYQAMTSRDVTVTENPELHLVWAKNRIFIKPLPRWLLDPDFWAAHLVTSQRQPDTQKQQLAACALGFLFTYTALIAYESDFRIAIDKGLVPEMSWDKWRALSGQVVRNHCYASVNPRYWYGELRLSRLNKIYRFRMGYVLRGYSKVVSHAVYEDLLQDNFATLAAVLGYVVIVLTAMQVGLSTEKLTGDRVFQDPPRPERHCLVTVGATARFTQLLSEALDPSFLDFLVNERYTHLTLQCGKDFEHFSREVLPSLVTRHPALEITAFDFVDDLAVEMAKCRAQPGVRDAGVVICHAGTGTILDGMRVSVPLVVVPNPTLKDNHQVELAEEIQRQGYGIWGRLDDISWALEQLALLLSKNEQQFWPHPVSSETAPVDVDLWQASSALMGRYSGEAAPAPTAAVAGGTGEVQREEVAQMTMG
ncbi:UDP-N-acetylglucosamine transferase subunit alg13 [Colletotrichum chlorophyti]|uniref:UDP-N-acetylglucosamine transferase subunit ALG13 n=1 Tax=Colletotrichum chlorophyti TaxID=708187 RepID=A0A1Q8RCX0_9PEZI|nr:UDP-N-acetylglucosamine transferase subunit alg13 [Colletotrichum chlorophyti]